jgi:hypothetical protein
MTVTVPATDVANYALQAQITALGTLITANPNASNLTYAQTQAQLQLLINLLGNGADGSGNQGGQSFLSPSGALSSLTINT